MLSLDAIWTESPLLPGSLFDGNDFLLFWAVQMSSLHQPVGEPFEYIARLIAWRVRVLQRLFRTCMSHQFLSLRLYCDEPVAVYHSIQSSLLAPCCRAGSALAGC